jgi:hypothetical protein
MVVPPGQGPRDLRPRPSWPGPRRETIRAVSEARHPLIQSVSEEARVTQIELFFDLVFVFSLTRVTALMSRDLTPTGLLHGLLVLALLWWSWVGYAWLGNVVRADEGVGRVAMFGAMAATFVLALSVPEAYEDARHGLDGPVVFAWRIWRCASCIWRSSCWHRATTRGSGARSGGSRRP